MATWIVRGNQSRAVPDVSVRAYLRRGWTVQEPDRPSESAPKPEWVAYAQAQGVDTDDMTKAEIIAAVTDPA